MSHNTLHEYETFGITASVALIVGSFLVAILPLLVQIAEIAR